MLNFCFYKILRALRCVFQGIVKGSVELNQNMYVCGLSKGCNSGMTEYIHLKFKGDDQLIQKAIFARCYYYNHWFFYFYYKCYYYYH